MKSVGFFVFGECEIYKRDKVKIRLAFYICIMHRRRKYIRCPEERSSFGSGLSNRGELHPGWQGDFKGEQRSPLPGMFRGDSVPL